MNNKGAGQVYICSRVDKRCIQSSVLRGTGMRRDGSFRREYPDNTFYLVKMLVDEMNKQQISATICAKRLVLTGQ